MTGTIVVYAISALGIILAGACIYQHFMLRRLVRLVAETPTTRISSTGPGYAAVEGKAEPGSGGLIHSPLTQSPCCWYRYKVEQRNSANGAGSWTVLREETSDTHFLLRDQSGVCAVDPCRAEVFPTDRGISTGVLVVAIVALTGAVGLVVAWHTFH